MSEENQAQTDLSDERRHRLIPLNAHEVGLVLQPEFGSVQIQALDLLAGGFSNTNYRVRGTAVETSQSFDIVLRLYPYGNTSAAKELALLRALHGRVPVPKVLAQELDALRLPYPFAILEYVPGSTLETILATTRDPGELASIGQSVGFTLAQIHALNFPSAGLIGADLKIATPFEDFALEMLDYITTRTEKGPARLRMGPDLADQVLGFLAQRGSVLQTLKRTRQLTHADFNPKNILMKSLGPGAWAVAAVLDWEFALAGSPLIDLGNMLRTEETLPPSFRQSFVSGYERGASPLEADWRLAAAIIDLSSQVEFLESETERPRTFANAIAAIERTVRL